jgi:hypothetical protein
MNMNDVIKKQLDESLRDALLAFYLNNIAPNDATKLKSAQDLYEYWLLDVLVSQDVPTTPVACAIASLQQYINRILMNMEAGYDPKFFTAEHWQSWRNELHQYPVWAAYQKLHYFPSTYLDPTLRANKSDNFQQLENVLNQNRIQPDAVQSAILGYLARFEEVANLTILNGYIDGEDFANSTYYFIAKSRTENTYFWRSLDMAQRPLTGTPAQPPAIAAKLDQPHPYAWSDWEKADVPVSESAVENSIRPVWFNNRLFIIWAECICQDQSALHTPSNVTAVASRVQYPLLRLSYCFKKQDRSWSTPRVVQQQRWKDDALADIGADVIKSMIGTVAIQHRRDSSDVLLLALCARDPGTDLQSQPGRHSTFIWTTYIDKNLRSDPVRLTATQDAVKQKFDPNGFVEKVLIDFSAHRLQTKGYKVVAPSDDTQASGQDSSASDTFSYQGPVPPSIISESKSHLGSIQFMDFAKSPIENSDGKSQKRQRIRLNTVFAAELIRRTENSLDELFDLATQQLPEPAISSDQGNRMDFHGPYGRYFTELFLYLPWLVAYRLNAEHRYEEAERWLRYVFDPGRTKTDCWKSVPLFDSDMTSYSSHAPHDPHQIALSHPVHFRKALYFLYLDILTNRGDAAYRELTPDSLSEAKLWYVRTLDLLGPRPVVRLTDHWPAVSLEKLSLADNDELRSFEDSEPLSTTFPPSFANGGSSQAFLVAIDSPHFRLPFNSQLLKCWDVVESRLYNLRHNLDIAGKPLHLPLFAAPLDPRALLGVRAPTAPDGASTKSLSGQIPHYRFTFMHSQAQNAVDSVSQFGATLVSLIERSEQAQLQELQQQQAWDLAKISLELQRQALNVNRQNRQALLASQAIIQNRVGHYKKLLDDALSLNETQASQSYVSSGTLEAAAMTCQIAAGGLMMAPNVFGFSNGGSRWEGPTLAVSAAFHSSAIISRTVGAQLDRQAIFSRREDEWRHAHDQSRLELAQIDAQLAQFTEQETATRLQLCLAESALSQAKANYDFLSKRFTKSQLYQWLNCQFAALYHQAYDATMALCLEAEACWQYEIADFDMRFIQPGTWYTTYRGLGAGELLKNNLLKMRTEYLRRHERELEIRKTVSLRQLKRQTPASPLNKEWPQIHADLKRGTYEFELTQQLFEDDYKDKHHYLRRIKTISVSLPALIGPFENVRATLTQTASKVFLSPGDRGKTLESLRANQQIALSTGVDDNGLFTLNFNDERYLPFEHTGAISKWQLTFANPAAQQDLLDSLTDVIVHVSYTARVGAGAQ